MTDVLQDALSCVTATEPEDVGALQVFGLRWNPPTNMDYATLADALEAGLVEVVEVNEGGSVPSLKVVNRGDQEVLLLAGEILVGAKQNRVLNASMMVPAQSEIVVPVSCIEQGRWGYRSRKFASGDEFAHGHLKERLVGSTSDALRRRGYPGTDQGAVWREVRRKLGAMKSTSTSQDLHQVHQDRRKMLDEALGSLQLPTDCAGAAFAFGGRVAGVALFDQPTTLRKVLPKLARAYALDALEHVESPDGEEAIVSTWRRRLRALFPADEVDAAPAGESAQEQPLCAADVADWVHLATRIPVERFPSPGMGDDLRLQSDTHIGACLLVEQTPVHTELFSEGS